MSLCRQESKTDVFVKNKPFRNFTSQISIRGALDRYLKAPPLYNKRFSICDKALFSEANKTLNSYLKQLVKQGRIAATVHKIPLAVHAIKSCTKGELRDVPSAICQFTFNVNVNNSG